MKNHGQHIITTRPLLRLPSHLRAVATSRIAPPHYVRDRLSSFLRSKQNKFIAYTPNTMADIDDELLALAGDASSDEEDDAPMNISRGSSVSPSNNTAGGVSSKKSSGLKASRRQNDSEEEGEA